MIVFSVEGYICIETTKLILTAKYLNSQYIQSDYSMRKQQEQQEQQGHYPISSPQRNKKVPEYSQNQQLDPFSTAIKQSFKQQTEASFPIGSDDFQQMVTLRSIYVDKTLFIKNIIDMDEKAILITRPRRWGKSLNMNMLKYFLNIEVDEKGRALDPQPHRVLFTGGKTQILKKNIKKIVYLEPLEISHFKDNQGIEYIKYQGLSPVIYMSWKDLKETEHKTFKDAFVFQIKYVFFKHKYLLNQPLCLKNIEYASDFNKILSMQASPALLEKSLKFLSELLCKHYGKKVYILIDEYDAPFNDLLDQELINSDPSKIKQIQEERKQTSKIITSLLSAALKSNEYLEKGVLTGVYDTLKTQSASGLNNVYISRITDKDFDQFYGFTKEEIQSQLVAKIFNKEENTKRLKESVLNKITEWYNGYIVSENNCFQRKLYNPFAVILYLKSCIKLKKIDEGRAFWTQSGRDLILKKYFTSQNQYRNIVKILSLDLFQPTQLSFNIDVRITDLDFSKQINEATLVHLLLHSGYITGQVYNKQGKLFIGALIPNKETAYAIKQIFKTWAQQNKLPIDFGDHIDIDNPQNLKEKMLQAIRKIIENIGLKNEKMFNGIFAVKYASSKDATHNVSAEVHSGSGIIDTIFYPKLSRQAAQKDEPWSVEQKNVIIHEYKLTNNYEGSQELYNKALWQILQKGYLGHPLAVISSNQENKKFTKKFSRIILRPIIIVNDQRFSNQITFFMKQDIVHSIAQANRIYKYFGRQDIVNTLQDKKKDEARKNLLEKEKVDNIESLIKKISEEEKKKRSFKKDEKGRYQPKVSAEDILQAIGRVDPRDLEKVYKKIEELKKNPNYQFNPKTFEAKKEE